MTLFMNKVPTRNIRLPVERLFKRTPLLLKLYVPLPRDERPKSNCCSPRRTPSEWLPNIGDCLGTSGNTSAMTTPMALALSPETSNRGHPQ